jgi:hypothetical protein
VVNDVRPRRRWVKQFSSGWVLLDDSIQRFSERKASSFCAYESNAATESYSWTDHAYLALLRSGCIVDKRGTLAVKFSYTMGTNPQQTLHMSVHKPAALPDPLHVENLKRGVARIVAASPHEWR